MTYLDQKPVFIITHGRSGSTLLQGILNQLFGGCIRGENAGFVAGIQEAMDRLDQARFRYGYGAHKKDHAWYGVGDCGREQMVAQMRELLIACLLRPPASARLIGYKEIRYMPPFVSNLEAHLDFLVELFPDARFIFNLRLVEDTIKSGWWPQDPDAEATVTGMHEAFDRAYKSGRYNAMTIHYEDLIEDPVPQVGKLASFLREPEPDPSAIRAVLSRRVSVDSSKQGSDHVH